MVLLNGCRSGRESEFLSPPPLFGLSFFLQHCPKLLKISRYHGKCYVTLKAVDAMVGAGVQAVNFQCIDGGFDRRVLPSSRDKIGLTLPGVLGLVTSSLFRQYHEFQSLAQLHLIVGL